MKPKVYKPITQPKRNKKGSGSPSFKKALLHTENGIKCIKLKFPWNFNNLQEVKNIIGRVYFENGKYWTVPLTYDNCKQLKEIGYILNASLRKWGNDAHKKIYQDKFDIPLFKGTLLPYQQEGVQLLTKFQGNALLADDMGLGKTIQAIAFLAIHTKVRPAVILCPAFLKLNWLREIKRFLPSATPQVINGTNKEQKITGDIIIINYQVLSNKYEDTGSKNKKGKPILKEMPYTGWVDYLIDHKFKIIIADESHYIKNDKAKQTKASFKLRKSIPMAIPMTGTPIEGKTVDLYNSVKFANSSIFPNKWSFQHEYCGPKHNGFAWTFEGATNTRKLSTILRKNVMIRRLKKDVLTDLPPKTYSMIPLEINNYKEYNKAESAFKDYIREKTEIEVRNLLIEVIKKDTESPIEINDFKLERLKEKNIQKANPLAQLTALKILASKGKLELIINWVENFLETGNKLVLFCEHKFVIEEIVSKFNKIAVAIHGGVPNKKRDQIVQDFQNKSSVKLLIANKAGQEGLTLTASNHVGIIEYPWNPGALDQRIDRVHRIGQNRKVNVLFFFAVDTIEEKMVTLLDNKKDINQAVLDGKELGSFNLLTELMNSFK